MTDMIRTIIVDDEPHCIDRLRRLLEQHAAHLVEVVGVFGSMEAGVAAIRSLRPELVFLDVQLQGDTAFDLLQQVKGQAFEIVFTTAFDQYAVEAFKFSAVDYLLKPVDGSELLAALERLSHKFYSAGVVARLENLWHNVQAGQLLGKRICVPVAEGLEFVAVQDLVRCESSSNYTMLFTRDGQKLVVSRTLKEFESMLAGYPFFRVHHSHLINLHFIQRYNKGKGGSVTLLDGSEVEVSVRRKEEFLKRLMVL